VKAAGVSRYFTSLDVQLRNLSSSRSHEIATIKHYSSNTLIGNNPSLPVEARGRDSSVGKATRYGLDGPGIESRVEARFSANVQIGPGAHQASYTRGNESFLGRNLDHPPHQVPRLKKEYSYTSTPLLGLRGPVYGKI
jgi:hypothetical protein